MNELKAAFDDLVRQFSLPEFYDRRESILREMRQVMEDRIGAPQYIINHLVINVSEATYAELREIDYHLWHYAHR